MCYLRKCLCLRIKKKMIGRYMEIKRFDDFIICPIPAESELDQVEIEKIVAHTRNTWQHDRQNGEMRENTIQGKRAEIVIENILNDNSTSRFLAYDKIRRDNFNKHAPFDGIIYRKDISANILQSAIDKVNNDVINSGGNTGIITVDTRKYMESMDKAYQVRRLFVRDEAKKFTMVKELRNLDFDGLGERETLEKLYKFFQKKYSLGNDMRINQENLRSHGYNFDPEIDSEILQGLFRTTDELVSGAGKNNVMIKTAVNTHTHGIYLLHCIDEIKRVTGLQSQKTKNILCRMFSKGKRTKYKFIALEKANFYAFIINNVRQLKSDFKECTAQLGGRQMSLNLEPKCVEFSIPEMEVYKYSEVKQRRLMRLNAYLEYTNEFITEKTRSMPERLFERYCETRADKIEWVYKNGDAGQQYLSIVYVDALLKQWLFYPDYIVKTKDGQVWVIETKGGEVGGHSKNIDIQVENKFIAFKQYAKKYKLNFGFVRDINEELFINNTEYHEDMSHDSWRPLEELL